MPLEQCDRSYSDACNKAGVPEQGEVVSFSIVVLTYNRLESLRNLLAELTQISYPALEILVVDNASEIPASSLQSAYPWVRFIRSPSNLGTGGRNIGFEAATGQFIVSIDDDVSGLSSAVLEQCAHRFQDPGIACVNFKVIEAGTGKITNWVHHCPVETYADISFDTYEITEGAVAFRKSAAAEAGYYPASFFISHEGPDLAFRLMDRGHRVIYAPEISVIHAYSPHGRTSWRNYYFDTRNTLWLVVRNCPPWFGMRLIFRQTGAMLLYSIRDGFFLWWVRGLVAGIRGLPEAWKSRRRMSVATMARLRAIDSRSPSLWYMLRKRLFQRGVKI